MMRMTSKRRGSVGGSASPRACRCGAPGMPCLACNEREPNERLRMPAGFTPRDDADKGPIH
jgi:hypothetical protein